MVADPDSADRVARVILLHLLENRAQQTRFEASELITEPGILKTLGAEDPELTKKALRELETRRLIYRRTQYVVGHSEAKHVFVLTRSGHRIALECQKGVPLKLESVQIHSGGSSTHADYPDGDDRSYNGDDLPDDPGDDLEFSHGSD